MKKCTLHINTFSQYGDSTNKKAAHDTPEDNIIELREYDITYYTRVTIDCDLRVGKWYDVKAYQGTIILELRENKITRPDPVILAFDIETTKLPLKFPDVAIDSIMMISYMIDGEVFLFN
jgi:DNA polymerase epsilon subunit 1